MNEHAVQSILPKHFINKSTMKGNAIADLSASLIISNQNTARLEDETTLMMNKRNNLNSTEGVREKGLQASMSTVTFLSPKKRINTADSPMDKLNKSGAANDSTTQKADISFKSSTVFI